jgi:hypothetical protein
MNKADLMVELERYWQDQLRDSAGDEGRRAEVERQLLQVRFLPRREHRDPEDQIVPSTLVEIETISQGGSAVTTRSWCYLIPTGGGLVLAVGGQPVQVLTPQSPLGAALLGHKRGDVVSVAVGKGTRRVQVVDFC